MKVLKTILNLFGILLAIILSLFTFATLLATPVVSAGTSLLKPDTIQQVIQDMNLSEQLEKTLKESAHSDLQNLDVKFIDDLMASELMNDILQLYIDNMVGLLEKDYMETINQQQIQELLNKHTPTLVTMTRSYLPSDLPLSDTEISKYACDMLEPALLTMVSTLPTLEELGIDNTTLAIIHMLYNGILLKYCFVGMGILSALVFLCRFPRFKGFMWLGITYLFSAIVLFLVTGNVDAFISSRLPESAKESLSFAIEPISSLLKTTFTNYGRIIISLAIVFIILFVLGRFLLSGKKAISNKELAA